VRERTQPRSAGRRGASTSGIGTTGVDAAIAANPWTPWVLVRVEADADVADHAEATGI